MTERLGAFDLEVKPTKRAVLRFGTWAERDSHKDGVGGPKTFSASRTSSVAAAKVTLGWGERRRASDFAKSGRS